MNEIDVMISELAALVDEEKRRVLPRFFKTGKGEYGEGDKFMGVTVPNIRSVAVKHLDVGMDVIDGLLASEWHEQRMCGLMIMVESCKRMTKKYWTNVHTADETVSIRKTYFDFYLSHTDKINNWDLVDLTAPTIVGEYLINRSHAILYKLADSHLLWDQRISVISTFAFIRRNDFHDIISLSERLLHHPHDLMQKAIGWMLREVGKRDKSQLVSFLDLHSHDMPRTMLRYAIEKFPEEERRHYMNATK